MPCLRVYTNVDTDKATQVAFLKDASAMLAKELRKPEGYTFYFYLTWKYLIQ